MKLISLIIGCLLWHTSFAQKSTLTTGGYALSSYDAVSYFEQDGPQKGLKNFQTNYKGAIYLFRSQAHLEAFQKNPAKYVPQYGGWCAYAMASGRNIDVQPQVFTIHGNRAHYFVSTRAKRLFDQDVLGHEELADGHWKRLSGEEPRF